MILNARHNDMPRLNIHLRLNLSSMTTKTPLIAAGCLIAAAASAFTVTEYRQAPAIDIPLPALPDSTMKENAFELKDLLSGRTWRPGTTAMKDWKIVQTDTSGRILLTASNENPALHSFATRLRAAEFAKGKLLIKATSRVAVKVDGETLITKAASDSLAKDSEASIELLPGRTYDITVDLLATKDDQSAPEFSLEFVADDKFKDVEILSSSDLSRRVQPVTALTGERAYRARLSHDGKYMLYCTADQQGSSDTRYRGRLVETATGRTLSDNFNYYAKWLQGENTLVYTVSRGKTYDLYAVEVPSMYTRLLATDLPSNDLTLSPDGNWLLYTKKVDGETESGPMHRVRTPDDRIPGDRERYYMMRYDLKNGITTPVTYGGPSTSTLDISDDGKKMLYLSTVAKADTYPFYFSDLIQMDMETLKTDTLFRGEEGYINAGAYSPDGKKIFLVGGPDSFGGIGANYGSHEIGNGFDGQGFIFDIASRSAKAMTRDFDPAITGEPIWNRTDGKVYFLGETGFYKYVYALDPNSGKISKVATESPYIRSFSIGRDEDRLMAYVGGSFTSDGVVGLTDLRNGKSRTFADPLAPTLEDITFGEMKPWTFTASDGTVVDGYECLPPDFDPNKRYPLIVYYYGGTSPSNATFYHLYSPQVFASRDYVVYVVNPSGTTGYGQEYSARHVNAWGKRTADEIIEGTKRFCAERKYVDDKKIGCIGASYGGFMTQYLQTKTDIFAAAVSHAGISNVTSYWGEGYWGYSYNAVAAAKSYPWTDPKLFTEQGSLFNADKIHTPLLLLHGEVDTNVPIGESIQLFNALKILGREVELITVQDENHVISDYERRQVWQNTIMAWFAKWLKDDPRWWDSLYGE